MDERKDSGKTGEMCIKLESNGYLSTNVNSVLPDVVEEIKRRVCRNIVLLLKLSCKSQVIPKIKNLFRGTKACLSSLESRKNTAPKRVFHAFLFFFFNNKFP